MSIKCARPFRRPTVLNHIRPLVRDTYQSTLSDWVRISERQKTTLGLHENYDAAQLLFGKPSSKPSLAGVIPDDVTGHDGGAVGGKASTFAGAETIPLPGATGPNATMSVGFWFKTSSAVEQYAFTDYVTQGWIGGLVAGKLRVYVREAAIGNYKLYNSNIDGLDDGNWHFGLFTFSGGVLKLYIDGVEDTNPTKINDDSVTTIAAGGGSSFRVSGFNTGSNLWNGEIQWPCRWDGYALTPHEIALLADKRTLPDTLPDFLGYLIGDKCHDITGNLATVTGTATLALYTDVSTPQAPFDLDTAGNSAIWDVTSATDAAVGPEIVGAPIESGASISLEIKTSDAKGMLFGNNATGAPWGIVWDSGSSTTLHFSMGTPVITVGDLAVVDGVTTTAEVLANISTGGWVKVTFSNVDLSAFSNGLFLSGVTLSTWRWDGQVRNLVINGVTYDGPDIQPKLLNSTNDVTGGTVINSGRAKKPGQLETGNAIVLAGSEEITITNTDTFSGATTLTQSGYFVVDALGATVQTILSQLDGAGTGESWLYKNASDALATDIGGSTQTFTNTLAAAKVYYFELSKSGTTWTLTTTNKTDGLAAVSDSVTATLASATGNFKIGSDKASGNRLTGKVWGFKNDHANGFEQPACERSGLTLYDVSGNGKDGAATATISHSSTVNDVYHYPEAKGYSPIWDITSETDAAVGPEVVGAPIESGVSISFEIKTTDAQGIVFGNGTGGAHYILAFDAGDASTVLFSNAGTPTLTVGGSDLSSGSRDELKNVMCTGNWVTVSMTDLDLTLWTAGLLLAGYGNSSWRWDGQVRNLVINGVPYDGPLIVPALEDGTADAQGDEILRPAGKYYNSGAEINHNPDGIYQFADNLWQWASFNGSSSEITFDSDISLTGDFEISLQINTVTGGVENFMGDDVNGESFAYVNGATLSLRINNNNETFIFSTFSDFTDWSTIVIKRVSGVTTITANGELAPETLSTSDTFAFSRFGRERTLWFEGSIRNLKIIDAGTKIVDMPLIKSGRNLANVATPNHGTPTDVTFAKQTLDNHDFGDTPEIPTSVDQATAGEEKEHIIFSN